MNLPHAATIDTVLFDLGNVLIGWDPYLSYDGHMTRAEVDQFFDDIDFPAFNREQDAGRTWVQARAALDATHPHHTSAFDWYMDHFPASLTGPIPGSEDVVRDLAAAGVRLFGLSNWSAETFHHAPEVAPAITLLTDVLVSGTVGLAKPDARIFELAITRFALDPARTLFVDDSGANTTAAARLGFATHLFTSSDALRADLTARGVLPTA